MAKRDYYEILKVNQNASDTEIKKAYRRLMSQSHPDKLISQGATEDELEEATDKVQEIQRAYEIVSKSKKIR